MVGITIGFFLRNDVELWFFLNVFNNLIVVFLLQRPLLKRVVPAAKEEEPPAGFGIKLKKVAKTTTTTKTTTVETKDGQTTSSTLETIEKGTKTTLEKVDLAALRKTSTAKPEVAVEVASKSPEPPPKANLPPAGLKRTVLKKKEVTVFMF